METRRSVPDADRFAVSSRRHALDWLRDAILCGPGGPVLITGEPGIGKTWLVRCFVEGLPTGWQTAELEMSSALDGVELLRLAGAGLGLAIPDRLGAAPLEARRGPPRCRGRRPKLAIDRGRSSACDSGRLGGAPGPLQSARPAGWIRRPHPDGPDRSWLASWPRRAGKAGAAAWPGTSTSLRWTSTRRVSFWAERAFSRKPSWKGSTAIPWAILG